MQPSAIGQIAKVMALINQKELELAKREIPTLQTYHSDEYTPLLKVIQVRVDVLFRELLFDVHRASSFVCPGSTTGRYPV